MNNIEYEDYIFTYFNMGDRLGDSRLSLIRIDNLPILLILSNNTDGSFSTMINMISGRFYDGDILNNEECILLNEFMNQSPNFHDGIHCEEGDCNNWSFMIIQYLADITPRTNKITNILLNIRKSGDKIIVPRFDLCNSEWIDVSIDKFITDLNTMITEDK